ncbi:MAG: rod shape-determining protein MreD [Ignavibacteriales bacterium CG07_land_8_20_14_0_80_59_12]|nr:MAG: rod shape-determining protein MreD [Ignavibacteriales bacterium CG07_land_8_20_14_0_80_59_12]
MKWILQYVVVAVAALVLQATLGQLISLDGVKPDFLLIWVVFVALRRGHMSAIIAGSGAGLAADLLSGEFIGIGLLAKATAGFLAGFLYRQNQIAQSLGSWWFLGIVGLISLIHNAIFFFFYLQGTLINFWSSFSFLGIGSTLYTSAFAIMPFAYYRNQYEEHGELPA